MTCSIPADGPCTVLPKGYIDPAWGWILGAGWSIVNNQAVAVAATEPLVQEKVLSVGKDYRAQYTSVPNGIVAWNFIAIEEDFVLGLTDDTIDDIMCWRIGYERVRNGDFDTDVTGWDEAGLTDGVWDPAGKLNLPDVGASSSAAQIVPVIENRKFIIDVDEVTDGRITVYQGSTTAGEKIVDAATSPGILSFFPTGDTILVELHRVTGENAYFDGITVRQGEDVIKNGDFESRTIYDCGVDKVYDPTIPPLENVQLTGQSSSIDIAWDIATSYPDQIVQTVVREVDGDPSNLHSSPYKIPRDMGMQSTVVTLPGDTIFQISIRPETSDSYGDWQIYYGVTDPDWDSSKDLITANGDYVFHGGKVVFHTPA